MLMLAVIGDDIECDAGLRRIFGEDLRAGVDHLAEFLTDLGVSVSSEDHGVPREAFRNLITAAFVGERGQNFIGSNDRVMAAEEQQWEARNRPGHFAGRTDANDTTSQWEIPMSTRSEYVFSRGYRGKIKGVVLD